MLSFTQKQPNQATSSNELDFQPLVISNRPPLPFPSTQQKIITKTVTNTRNKDKSRQTSRHSANKDRYIQVYKGEEKHGWSSNGKIQMFDGNLRKNALAEQERRLKAEMKKQKFQAIKEVTRKQQNIGEKKLKLQLQQQKQIDQLKRLIEKEREEKEKNDRAYNEKLKQIEKERKELIMLERKIQEHGPRNQKEYKQEINVLRKNQYPTNDRAKCHQEIRTSKEPGPQYQLSESQANQQRQALRQKQLELLTQQREKNMQNQATLNYNPTIVPLLSRASYKIISTHVSTLVQLLVDDILQEQVYLLEQIQMKERLQKEKEKEKNMIKDYYQALEEFVDEAEHIENKIGRYQTMKFEDLYLPKHYPKEPIKLQTTEFNQVCLLEGLQSDTIEEIGHRKDRFVRFVDNFDEYKKGHLTMFEKVTEELIDDAIFKLAQELDRGSNDFVELMFRKEFQ